MTSLRADSRLANDASKVHPVKSLAEAVRAARREVVALARFKDLIRKNAGKLSFKYYCE